MDVVFVTDVAFWERSLGSEERIHQLISALAPVVDVGVFFINRRRIALPADIGVPVFDSVKIAIPPGSKPEVKKGIEFGFDAATATAFSAFCRAHLPRMGIYEYITTAYLAFCTGAPAFKVLDTHDVMSRRIRTFARFGKKHHIELGSEEELRILHAFNCVLAIQLEEFGYLARALGPGRVLHLPLMVAPPPPRRYRARARSVIFVGGNSPMNADGLRWFCREAWPLIRREGLHLDVFGAVSDATFPEEPDVVRHGRVPRTALEAAYLDADLAINPVYYGGGLKVKTIEYAAFGIPAVLTGEAARGIPHDPARSPFLLARTREEFVTGLRLLLGNVEARLTLASRAESFIEGNYGLRHTGTIRRLVDAAIGVAV